MPIQDYPLVAGALTERKRTQFEDALHEIEAGLAAGEMPNARYTRVKETLSRSVEYAWQELARKPFAWNRDYIAAAPEDEGSQLRDIDGPPQTNTIAKLNRQADALGDTEAGRAIRAVLAEATPVVDMIKRGKDIAVKKTAAPKEPTAAERYQAPAASGTAMAAILGELEATVADAKAGIATSIRERHEKLGRRFLEAAAEHAAKPAEDRKGRVTPFSFARRLGNGKAEAGVASRIEAVVRPDRNAAGGWALKPDADRVMTESAERDAEAICRSYVEKNMEKLAPIVEGRGDYSDMKVLGRSVNPGAMEGRLRISFESGASFEARSQAVMSFSHLGTPFMRFPLTFHDVVMDDGSKMSRPSEKKMNEEFARGAEAPQP